MNGPMGKAANWAGVIIAAIIPVALALMAFGVLRSDVRHNSDTLIRKQDKEVAKAQYEALCDRLDRMEATLDQILAQTR